MLIFLVISVRRKMIRQNCSKNFFVTRFTVQVARNNIVLLMLQSRAIFVFLVHSNILGYVDTWAKWYWFLSCRIFLQKEGENRYFDIIFSLNLFTWADFSYSSASFNILIASFLERSFFAAEAKLLKFMVSKVLNKVCRPYSSFVLLGRVTNIKLCSVPGQYWVLLW